MVWWLHPVIHHFSKTVNNLMYFSLTSLYILYNIMLQITLVLKHRLKKSGNIYMVICCAVLGDYILMWWASFLMICSTWLPRSSK